MSEAIADNYPLLRLTSYPDMQPMMVHYNDIRALIAIRPTEDHVARTRVIFMPGILAKTESETVTQTLDTIHGRIEAYELRSSLNAQQRADEIYEAMSADNDWYIRRVSPDMWHIYRTDRDIEDDSEFAQGKTLRQALTNAYAAEMKRHNNGLGK